MLLFVRHVFALSRCPLLQLSNSPFPILSVSFSFSTPTCSPPQLSVRGRHKQHLYMGQSAPDPHPPRPPRRQKNLHPFHRPLIGPSDSQICQHGSAVCRVSTSPAAQQTASGKVACHEQHWLGQRRVFGWSARRADGWMDGRTAPTSGVSGMRVCVWAVCGQDDDLTGCGLGLLMVGSLVAVLLCPTSAASEAPLLVGRCDQRSTGRSAGREAAFFSAVGARCL